MLSKTQLALAISSSLFLSACGGADSSGSPTPPLTKEELKVTVIDGYIENAQVWLESRYDPNYFYENGEITGVTNAAGVAILDVSKVQDLNDFILVVKAQAGKAIDKDHGKTLLNDLIMTANAGEIVTPLTTLVEARVRQGATYAAAKAAVASELGLSADKADLIVSDFIASQDEDAGKVAQAAVSLVASGVMPSTQNDARSALLLTQEASALFAVYEKATDNQIVVEANGQLTLVDKVDTDGDKIIDALDAFPNDAAEWYDSDQDGIGNNKDAFEYDPSESSDTDKDGVGDNADVFENDPKEWADTDKDGIGNNADLDDDDDGYPDAEDNQPLVKLASPQTYGECLASLPKFENSDLINAGAKDARAYAVKQVRNGTEETFKQVERYLNTQTALPKGEVSESMIDVWQITSFFADKAVDADNPYTSEFEYIGADSGIYYGFNEAMYRWWGIRTDATDLSGLILNEPQKSSVTRLSPWNPQHPVTYVDAQTTTYQGKRIIPSTLGYREVCVTSYEQTLMLGETLQDSYQPALKVVESGQIFMDYANTPLKYTRDYNEYAPDKPETPTQSRTGYVKELAGVVSSGDLFGANPYHYLSGTKTPQTLEQCLADLPKGVLADVGDVAQYDIKREKNAENQQWGTYNWYLKTANSATWQGQSNLIQSQLIGQLYSDESKLGLPNTFTETYYETADKTWVGLIGQEGNSKDIKWGSVVTSRKDVASDEFAYLPSFVETTLDPINKHTQYLNWSRANASTSEVFAGKERISYTIDGVEYDLETCRIYSDEQVTYFDQHTSPLAVESKVQTTWFDNNGVVKRERFGSNWKKETWHRVSVNQQK